MKTLIRMVIGLAATVGLTASADQLTGDNVDTVRSTDLLTKLQVIETLNVTAYKPADDGDTMEDDAEIEDILMNAESAAKKTDEAVQVAQRAAAMGNGCDGAKKVGSSLDESDGSDLSNSSSVMESTARERAEERRDLEVAQQD